MKRARSWKYSKTDIAYERLLARWRARGVAIGITVNTALVLYEAYEKLTVALLSLGAIEPEPDAPEWGMEQC